MTGLVHALGLSKNVSFHDVFSIDEPELLSFVPRPAHALLLVFPVTETHKAFRREEDADRSEYTGSGEGEEVVWYKQTIGNACGLIGLLHAVSNGPARDHVGTSPLRFPSVCEETNRSSQRQAATSPGSSTTPCLWIPSDARTSSTSRQR